MGKNKGINPAEAHRKNQRKKELQKNKDARRKAREFNEAKQDTGQLEEEIEDLESRGELMPEERGHLAELRQQLKRALKAKEDYLKEHPEHRSLIYSSAYKRSKGLSNDDSNRAGVAPGDRSVFGKDGLPLRPERSIYYDPVMNPYGVPPPGMPYIERPATPEPMEDVLQEESGDSSDDGEDSDGIRMPPGPPPGVEESSDEDDEKDQTKVDQPPLLPPDFVPPLPPGPIPPNAILAPGFVPSLPYSAAIPPPPPPGFGPPLIAPVISTIPGPNGQPLSLQPPPPPPGFGPALVAPTNTTSTLPLPPPPPPPPGFPVMTLPAAAAPPPPPPLLNMPDPSASLNLPPGAIPPPPFGFPNFPPNMLPPPVSTTHVVPRAFRHAPPVHSLPHPHPRHYQHHQQRAVPSSSSSPSVSTLAYNPSLPAKPGTSPAQPSGSSGTKKVGGGTLAIDDRSSTATVFAEPEMRDLKKEATAFVPRGIRAKTATTTVAAGSRGEGKEEESTGGDGE
ncbi:hypothetical protein FRC17_003406 [Serendipita sp. 399]|nr:hypothetical protein FRC17_003406 [Serendipita sp. 399]